MIRLAVEKESDLGTVYVVFYILGSTLYNAL